MLSSTACWPWLKLPNIMVFRSTQSVLKKSWLSENADWSLLQIEGFTCYFQGKSCTAHGGLLTYVSEDFNASKININIDSTVWEGLFILIKDLENQKDIVLGNIYRPPHDNSTQTNINTFVTELDPILSSLTNNKRIS